MGAHGIRHPLASPHRSPTEHESDGHRSAGRPVELLAASPPGAFSTRVAIPVRDLRGVAALVVAAILVGVALMRTGVDRGSALGRPPAAPRRCASCSIGYGVAATTYGLGPAVPHRPPRPAATEESSGGPIDYSDADEGAAAP